MATLGAIVGAIVGEIGQGRSQADAAALEVAQLYRQNPLLAAFPVPRMSLEEVVVDLKVAFGTGLASAESFTPEVKAAILPHLASVAELRPMRRALGGEEWDKFWKYYDHVMPDLMARMGDVIPAGAQVNVESLTVGISSLVVAHLMKTLDTREAGVSDWARRRFVSEQLMEVERNLAGEAAESIRSAVGHRPDGSGRLSVLVTAAELQAVPAEKITTLRLTLREADRVWTQIEGKEGVEDRLVPA